MSMDVKFFKGNEMKLDQAKKLIESSKSLKELLENIKTAKSCLDDQDISNLDLTSLPTFGGVEPDETIGIWSWDKDNLLIGDGDFEIVSREEYSER